jgi:5-formyltetrahydrofolate cyclo-ligase
VSSEEQLREGEFGFLEPNPEECSEIHDPDWILIPGVGFSPSNLARLGRGKGHYDRFLAPQRTRKTPPRLIGIGFETQLIQIEPESHDIAMDTLLTEAGWATEFR